MQETPFAPGGADVCPHCGAARIPGASFCKACGARFADAPGPVAFTPAPVPKKNHAGWVVALVSAAVLLFVVLPTVLFLLFTVRMTTTLIEGVVPPIIQSFLDEFVDSVRDDWRDEEPAFSSELDDDVDLALQAYDWRCDVFAESLLSEPLREDAAYTICFDGALLQVFMDDGDEPVYETYYAVRDDVVALFEAPDDASASPFRAYTVALWEEDIVVLTDNDDPELIYILHADD